MVQWYRIYFDWNRGLKAYANGRNKSQHCCVFVGQQCCVRLYGRKRLTGFKLYATSANKCQHCCGSMQTDASCWAQQCCLLLANNVASVCMALKYVLFHVYTHNSAIFTIFATDNDWHRRIRITEKQTQQSCSEALYPVNYRSAKNIHSALFNIWINLKLELFTTPLQEVCFTSCGCSQKY